MDRSPKDLLFVYDGWDGYNRSLVSAVSPLKPEQLKFRSTEDMRTVGEVAWHIGDGRVDWFRRINPQPCKPLEEAIEARKALGSNPDDAAQVADWLNLTWKMVEDTLSMWTVDDLTVSFNHPYQGKTYVVPRHWVVWRMITHDMHHGGQISELLAMQGVLPLELTLLGGHLTEVQPID